MIPIFIMLPLKKLSTDLPCLQQGSASKVAFLTCYLFKIIDIKKIAAFTKITRGPAGKLENSERIIPEKEDTTPTIIAPKTY